MLNFINLTQQHFPPPDANHLNTFQTISDVEMSHSSGSSMLKH